MPVVRAEHLEVVLNLLRCLCHKSLDNLRQKFTELCPHRLADAARALHDSDHLLITRLAT